MSIMDLLAQAGPPQEQPMPGPMGAQPMMPEPEGPDHSTLIRDILDQVRAAAQSADDEQEALTWEKISSLVQGILAAQEKQDRDLMQGKMPPGALQRVLGGG